ncbi:MAG: hypothetical protein Faunusvirus2_42 [Faunusvirus sp.]|jgi:ankyrin repeat protein|uniref:Uncharacterized protein n=1 Tax=Faunusvirus sp. TaxID=2487766 RepID=A0A3G4ZW35_9VIRU|nr:MAG: hypothetical protein Faunusvirus2_42 [Faunusvirus sp.]
MDIVTDHADEFVNLVRCGNEKECIEYINKYDDFYHTQIDGWNSIMYAIGYKHINVIKELIRKGINLNQKTRDGNTVLMLAYFYYSEDVVIMLIKAGADFINMINNYIVYSKHPKIIQCVREVYRQRIISVIDDDASDNAMAVSFRTTYASGVVDMISEFII